MAELSELRAERLKKLENLKSLGINPYPSKIELAGERISTTKAKAILESSLEGGRDEVREDVVLVGRVMTIRGQGKILFIDLADQDGKLQVVLKVDILGEEKIKIFFENIDAGDFLAFSGKLFTTARGEKSLEAHDYQILSKSLLPIPSSFYGLENEEELLRKRYLDFALNKEKRDLFFRKAKFWNTVRDFMSEKGFLEVSTPTIETTTGGAEARPFKTFHNDFDMEVFMRICIGELWQKRLLSGGFEKVFEIGRAYRNEGSSPMHLQEFTNCEFYWSYADYNDGMELVKELYTKIAKEVYGKTEFTLGEHTFDFANEWRLVDYVGEIKDKTGIDINKATDEEIKQKLISLGVKWDGENRERLTDTLWKYCRKQISGPAFLVNHPTLVSPLAKPNADKNTVQRFQPLFAGVEVGNGFSELNDPLIQRQNFEQQQKLIERGDEEAMMPDWEFVEMLEHGMPPAFGFGFGDRMFSILEGLPMRETELFPLVKPKEEKSNKKESLKVAAVVLNKAAGLEKWQELNTVGHLCAEFAGKYNGNLFYKDKIQTKDNQNINLNIQHAILLKETDSNSSLQDFIGDAQEKSLEVYTFTREMLNTTNDKKVAEETKKKDFVDVEFLGVLVFGEKEKIDALTKNFGMYK